MLFSSPSLVFSPSSLHLLPSSDPPYKLLKNHPSLSLLSKCKSIENLKQIHSQIIKTGLHNTQFALSKLIEFCAISPFGDLSYALSIFELIDDPNVFIWNTIIRGHSLSYSPILAVTFYVRMLHAGVEPNSYTFSFPFESCALVPATHEGRQIHTHVLKLGLDSDAFVHTSLINMYARNVELSDARLVFDKSSLRDAVSFTALITGYASGGYLDDAQRLFDEIPVRDVVSWNAIIAGYAQSGKFGEALAFFQEMLREKAQPNESTMCGDLEKACGLFDGICQRDRISWNVMIGGYTHMSHYKEALVLFRKMQQSNEEPNEVTFLSILPACANLGALDLGKWIHAYIDKNFSKSTNTSLPTSLIDMYAKCGNIKAALQVFDSAKPRSLASWNAMISGLAMHGHADMSLRLFSEMTEEGYEPDDITFVGLLAACSHAGLVEVGRQYFDTMIRKYKISPKVHHYGCMIDLVSRAGLFDEAEALMKNMEMKPDGAIWGSLLQACRVHGNVELGEFVARQLFELEPKNPGGYVLLSNIYAGAGRWICSKTTNQAK
ncbi:hypothetical protein HHK36_031727 [Tetracentron sinense]|uniref:Pentatricopeptide repeat-containing protein n=1 Tax=Tetracentron sinense TaxID=13715 RepID=A0A834YAK2_TETSI|nr:hypothetical protein HHK36_031727 [Tetracentron sinense]